MLEFAPAPGVKLTVLVAERTYLKVIVDGEVKQEGRVVPGAALQFEGKERIEVLTGSRGRHSGHLQPAKSGRAGQSGRGGQPHLHPQRRGDAHPHPQPDRHSHPAPIAHAHVHEYAARHQHAHPPR